MNIIEENNEEDESNHSYESLNRSLVLKHQCSHKSTIDQIPVINPIDSNDFNFEDNSNLDKLQITKPSLKNLFANDLKDLTSIIVSKNKSFVNLNLNLDKETNSSIRPMSKDSNIPKFNNSL